MYALATILVFIFYDKMEIILFHVSWIKDLVPLAGIKLSALTFIILSIILFSASRFGLPLSTLQMLLAAFFGIKLVHFNDPLVMTQFIVEHVNLILTTFALVAGLLIIIYPCFKVLRSLLNLKKQNILFASRVPVMNVANHVTKHEAIMAYQSTLAYEDGVDVPVEYRETYSGSILGLNFRVILDLFHVMLAGILTLIQAVFFVYLFTQILQQVAFLPLWSNVLLVLIAMVLGALLMSDKAEQSLTLQIANLDSGQALQVILVTLLLFIFSLFQGMAVNMTYLLLCSLIVMGLFSKSLQGEYSFLILMSWIFIAPAITVIIFFTSKMI